jgi:hypothetical protein
LNKLFPAVVGTEVERPTLVNTLGRNIVLVECHAADRIGNETVRYTGILEAKVRIDKINNLIIKPANKLLFIDLVDWKDQLNLPFEWDVIGTNFKAVEHEQMLDALIMSQSHPELRGRGIARRGSKTAKAPIPALHLVRLEQLGIVEVRHQFLNAGTNDVPEQLIRHFAEPTLAVRDYGVLAPRSGLSRPFFAMSDGNPLLDALLQV